MRVGDLHDSDMIARRVGMLAEVTCAAPAYIERFGMPANLDALAGHRTVGFHSSATRALLPLEFTIDSVVRNVVHQLRQSNEREVVSRQIGEWVMHELKRVDQVAYVRFASVYRRFEDVQAFREEIERLERDLPALEGLQLPLLGEVIAITPGKKR